MQSEVMTELTASISGYGYRALHAGLCVDATKQKNPAEINQGDLSCEPAGIQTPSLLIRSQMLYSVKLQALFFKSKFWTANVKNKLTQQNKTVWPHRQKSYFCPF